MFNHEFQWEKKYWLVVIGVACLGLAWYSINNKDKKIKLPLVDLLPAIGGGAYAANFLFNFVK